MTIPAKNQRCRCYLLSKWAKDPRIPIEFDSVLNEYYVRVEGGGRVFLYYCPVCGGRLPLSRRNNLFTKPSAKKMASIKNKISLASSMDDIVRILGEPDERYGPIDEDPVHKEIYNYRKIERGIRYSSLSKTLDLIVQEYEDGKFDVVFVGKLKS